MSECVGCLTCEARESCFRVSPAGRWSERILKLGGSVLFFAGALLFAVTTWAGSAAWVFGMFFVGHLCWAIAGGVMRDRGTVFLNATYLLFDASAVWIRF